ncbi:uncharacterized protein [Battus philenor]|uniref:uncharacterized protein n=1 Tax=Battus philenor TaxID=42288 RepID=UPI0035CEBAEF
MVFLSPSIDGIRKLLAICERAGMSPETVSPVYINRAPVQVVSSFLYLGHMLTENLKDHADIERKRAQGPGSQWLRVLAALGAVALARSQHTHVSQNVQQSGSGFEWSWQLTPVNTAVPVEQYYIQPVHFEQAGAGALHGAAPLQPADSAFLSTQGNYNTEIPVYEHSTNETAHEIIRRISEQSPVDIFLLNQQFPVPVLRTLHNEFQGNIIPFSNAAHGLFSSDSLAQRYNIHTGHATSNERIDKLKNINVPNEVESSKYTQTDFGTKTNSGVITPIVQVFKDHNCTVDDASTVTDHNSNRHSSTNVAPPTHDESIFGARQQKSSLYKQAADFKIETRGNTNNEGYYYYSTEASTTKIPHYQNQDGISRLVASTQNLISNDDLLRINHSVEKHVPDIIDDYIKPRPRHDLTTNPSHYYQNPHEITVKAKIRNIENRAVEYSSDTNEKKLQTNFESDKFTSPIVVQDLSDNEFKEQVLDTLVSTMTPYIDNGYEIASITKSPKNNTNTYVPRYFNGETVYVTPRPIGQKYLAPITVALRLLNSNHTELFNTVDDHDVSDSEFIEATVKSPVKERTVVEIQESIPIEIMHINDVETHEYLDFGRSNPSPVDEARHIYNTYLQYLQDKNNNENNINGVFNKYDSKNDATSDEKAINDDTKQQNDENIDNDKLEPSENVQSQVQVEYNNNDENNDGRKDENYYDKHEASNRKLLQPIIIEKEIPVPQYVEVVQPVDRPVPIPVPYEKIVEKPIEVEKYIHKPYPVEVPQPFPVPVKVPYPVKQKVYIDRPVHVPYPVEKIVEKQVVRTVPVPTPVHVPVEKPVILPIPVETPYPVPVEKPVHVEKIIHKEIPVPYPVEKKVLYPVPYEKTVHVPYPVETRIPVPVEKIVEKPVPVTQVVEKPVQVRVPVPVPVHIVKHYPVNRVVEKKIPVIFPVDRIVEKKVPVNVPYPVEKVIEKVVEKPVVITKYVDKIYPVETKVPYIVEKIIEKKVPYAVHVPYTGTSSVKNEEVEESRNYAQYQSKQSTAPNTLQKRPDISQTYLNQYYQYLKERQRLYAHAFPVRTNKWGNLYASSFNYVNVTPDSIPQSDQKNNVYSINNLNSYYGPLPLHTYDSLWEKNKSLTSEGSKRPDRTPKVTNLRIEYGGFKPPLIPSTEVDLDGRPIHREPDP